MDKGLLICLCVASALIGSMVDAVTVDAVLVAWLLAAILISASCIIFRTNSFAWVAPIAYVCASFFGMPWSFVGLPLVVYDLARQGVLRSRSWVLLPVVCSLPFFGAFIVLSAHEAGRVLVLVSAVICLSALLLGVRSAQVHQAVKQSHALRDGLQQEMLKLKRANARFHEAQDAQIRAATLSERARIARDIHDNVGHLLTRLIFQVKALRISCTSGYSFDGPSSEVPDSSSQVAVDGFSNAVSDTSSNRVLNGSSNTALDNSPHGVPNGSSEVVPLNAPLGVALDKELAEIEATLNTALDSMRKSVHALSDEGEDMPTALNAVALHCGVSDVRVNCTLDDAVPPAVSRCIVAVAKEALTNAAKHGQAQRAWVTVVEYPSFWRLTVENDGTLPSGDETSGETGESSLTHLLDQERGLGLRSMQDRVESLGGMIDFLKTPRFTVFATFPKEVS
ncbi:signal transduction histidine kinase [Cryptobacterium curtum DSM 15641]|uniref:Signal transduction histidine kinase n=1 Tax=Cryptobacterium curtum (strain ATCC 700683 / DSM 15641 / CCUG 43107 / 12-3) TaxID=469378 RepID=C7MPC1_CRYCD|nr:histidine kinase [Cryptobacterium curtum]ACU94761.1 signal transduction histidine kinase [Cryptobacterium curtum DSM 15641]